jgi:transposase-like protein
MSKRFSDQFRQSAVEMVSPEHPIAQVAHSSGIGYSTLDKWVRAHRRQTGAIGCIEPRAKAYP